MLSEGMFVLLTVQGLSKRDNLTNFGLRLKPPLLLTTFTHEAEKEAVQSMGECVTTILERDSERVE